jgi:hypothetical protein
MEWGLFGSKAVDFITTPCNQHKKITILTGSVRSGKTVAMIPKWLEYITSIKGLKLIVGVSKDTVYDNILTDLFDTIGPDNYIYTSTNGHLKIRFKNKSSGNDEWTVCKVIGAKDRGSEKYLRGKTIAGAYVDEGTLIPESFFKQLLNRCSVANSKIFITTNPDSPVHYLYNDYICNPERADIVDVYEFYLSDNPNLCPEYIKFISNAYSGIEYERFVLGKWKVTEGLVVKGYAKDNIQEVNYIPDDVIHLTCDFNVDPMCWLLAHKSDDRVYFFDEIVLENTNTREAVDEFYSRYPLHSGGIIINGDASGKNRSTNSEFTNYATMMNRLSELGYRNVKLRIKDYNPPVKSRIAAWNNKIRSSEGFKGVFIDPKCRWLIYNLESLKWKEGTSQLDLPTTSRIKGNRMLKYLGHPFDAASYLVDFYWPIRFVKS